jgi:hypothetical protein
VHFAGVIAQALLGAFIANAGAFGVDETRDYGTLQALSWFHAGVGAVTFGALTTAAALVIF